MTQRIAKASFLYAQSVLTILIAVSLSLSILVVFFPLVASAQAFPERAETLGDVPVFLPEDALVSPDDRHVYLLGDAAVAAFERDPAMGILRFLEAHLEGEAGVTGLRDAGSLALSPDGRFLYTATARWTDAEGTDRGSLTLFERDPSSGRLAFQGVERAGFNGLGGRSSSVFVVLPPGGAQLYAASEPDQAILHFERDAGTGGLRLAGAVPLQLGRGSQNFFAAFDPAGRHLYLTDRNRGSVWVFGRDAATGQLTIVEEVESPDPDHDRDFPVFPDAVTVSPDGRHVYVTNASGFPFDTDEGETALFERDPSSGRLTLVPGSINTSQPSPDQMAMTADGAFLYIPGWGSYSTTTVVTHARDAATGKLDEAARIQEGPEFFQFSSLGRVAVLSADDAHLYAGVFDGQPLAVFDRGADGTLGRVTDPGDPTGRGRLRGASGIVLSPDERFLYVASPQSHGIAVYRRGDSGLEFVELTSVVPNIGHDIGISQDGRFVYGLGEVFRRDADTGILSVIPQNDFAVQLDGTDFATSPDGRFLYHADQRSPVGRRPIQIFRQSAEGQLTFVDYSLEPVPEQGALVSVGAVEISADGAFIYASGFFRRSPRPTSDIEVLALYGRDAQTGLIELIDFVNLGRGNFLGASLRLALSPDGRHLYISRPLDDEVVVIEHDRRRGGLQILERLHNGENGVMGIDEPRGVAVAASGEQVYVVGRRSDAVTRFTRDPANGRLAFVETLRHAPPRLDGLFRATELALTRDSSQLYVVSPRLSSLTTLELGAPNLDCDPAAGDVCLQGGRFRVDVEWRTGTGDMGPASLVEQRDDSGLFWFFNAENWEMLVKVLDGCAVNGHFWVFSAATTDVEYVLRVTDTASGVIQSYRNPLGRAAPAITDTAAFETCP